MRWKLGAMLFAGLAVITPSETKAASFDCAKASKPAEKIICGDKALSAADEQLAKHYTRLLAEIPPALKPALQKSQRSWVVYAPLNCSADGRGTIKDREQFTQCLKSEYDQRIAVLSKQPQALGPFKTVMATDFQAMPSSSTDPDFFPTVSHSKSITIIYGGDEQQAKRLNVWLQSLASDNNAGWNDPEVSLSFTVSLSQLNAVIATATLASELFGVGAAHPISISSNRHLVLTNGKLLTARDMFQANARNAITNLVWAALKKNLGNDMMIDKKSELTKLIEDPGHWSFSTDGLTFNFNVYEVAAYVMGPQQVTISWASLAKFLAPIGESIAKATRN